MSCNVWVRFKGYLMAREEMPLSYMEKEKGINRIRWVLSQ